MRVHHDYRILIDIDPHGSSDLSKDPDLKLATAFAVRDAKALATFVDSFNQDVILNKEAALNMQVTIAGRALNDSCGCGGGSDTPPLDKITRALTQAYLNGGRVRLSFDDRWHADSINYGHKVFLAAHDPRRATVQMNDVITKIYQAELAARTTRKVITDREPEVSMDDNVAATHRAEIGTSARHALEKTGLIPQVNIGWLWNTGTLAPYHAPNGTTPPAPPPAPRSQAQGTERKAAAR